MRRHSFAARLGGATLWSAAMLAMLALGTKPSASADVHVFTSGAAADLLEGFAAKFAETTGNRIVLNAGTLAEIRERLSGATNPDVVVLPAPVMDALGEAGKLRPGSRVDL